MPKEHKRELSHRLAPSPLYPITDPQQDADFHMTAKSPVGPAPAPPTSVENSYRKKCLELKKRIREIEDTNDVLVLRIQRSRRGIQRARLERAFLLQALEDRTDARVDDSEGSPSPPPTPKEKPLRIKRPRKDAQDTPSRHHSQSPTREVYPMASYQSTFTSVNPAAAVPVVESVTSQPTLTVTPSGKKSGPRAPRGPKRPPNAYMIFCDKERNNIRREQEGDEDFDMHKALAKAWRDLGPSGQKPYFAEYDRNRERYKEECANATSAGAVASVDRRRGPRATSAASSVAAAPTPVDQADAASPPGSANEEMDEGSVGTGGGFTAVNR
ncbi:hypothetical protein DFH27DRAFT_362368 [Peziza echinospora]|nr:hypothetical protein DFH27DRAFT_362368 [Peziza echinospora]